MDTKNKKIPSIYFDNASTTQTPDVVLEAMNLYYKEYRANPGRGIYKSAERALEVCESVRQKVAHFIGARFPKEIIFTRGCTESINQVALCWGYKNIQSGDEIVVTELEHHTNFVPWQQLAKTTGAVLKIIPLLPSGLLDAEYAKTAINRRTKLVAITEHSNALCTANELFLSLITNAKKIGAAVLVDGAQAVGHKKIKVTDLGIDFYAFSGHKIYGPTGVGILYVNEKRYKEMAPVYFGGGAVYSVDKESTELRQPPYCYEPGTLSVAEIIGLGAALDFLEEKDVLKVRDHILTLVNMLIDGLLTFQEIRILGSVELLRTTGHGVSFVIKSMHAHDFAAYADAHGISVRAGHHCAQLIAHALQYDASVRVSFALYNSADQVRSFLELLKKIIK